jgi:hypothetical protein
VATEFVARPEVDFVYGDGDVIDEVGDLQWEWLSRSYNHSAMTGLSADELTVKGLSALLTKKAES